MIYNISTRPGVLFSSKNITWRFIAKPMLWNEETHCSTETWFQKIRVWFQLQTCFCYKDLVWTLEEVKLVAQKLLVSSKCNHINLQISCLLIDICKKNLLVNLLLLLLHQVEEVERIRSEKVIFFEEDDASIELLRRVENLKDLVCLPPPMVLCLGDLKNNFDAHIYRLEIKLMLPKMFLSHSRHQETWLN